MPGLPSGFTLLLVLIIIAIHIGQSTAGVILVTLAVHIGQAAVRIVLVLDAVHIGQTTVFIIVGCDSVHASGSETFKRYLRIHGSVAFRRLDSYRRSCRRSAVRFVRPDLLQRGRS